MRIVVVGGGKVGYYLCKTLLSCGDTITLVEENEALANRLAQQLDIPVVCGDGTALESLEKAQIRGADALIAATGQDEDNLICCQLCKRIFHLRKVIAKVNDPKNVEIFKRLGVDNAISSTDSIVRMLEREVDTSQIKELLEVGEDASIQEILLPEDYKLSGVPLSDLKLPQSCVIISVMRGKKLMIPRGSTKLESGDTLLVLTRDSAVSELLKRLKLQIEERGA